MKMVIPTGAMVTLHTIKLIHHTYSITSTMLPITSKIFSQNISELFPEMIASLKFLESQNKRSILLTELEKTGL